jgi:hypothetical protein
MNKLSSTFICKLNARKKEFLHGGYRGMAGSEVALIDQQKTSILVSLSPSQDGGDQERTATSPTMHEASESWQQKTMSERRWLCLGTYRLCE